MPHWCQFLSAIAAILRKCRTRARGPCGCCRCCRRTATGRAAELATRLEVSVRTLRRDVDRLRELGYPVEANRGVDGGYQLAAGAAMPPLVLDDEEAVALAVGLQAAAQSGVAGVAEASVRALAKVVPVMPPRLRRRVEALRTATVAVSWTGGPGRRPGGAHRRRAGLPRRRAPRVRLRRRGRHAHAAARRAVQAGVPGEAVVPRRVRPAPARLAQLPPGSAADAARDRRPVPPAGAAGRRRGGVRPGGHLARVRRTTRSRRWSRRRRRRSASGSAGGCRSRRSTTGAAACG